MVSKEEAEAVMGEETVIKGEADEEEVIPQNWTCLQYGILRAMLNNSAQV